MYKLDSRLFVFSTQRAISSFYASQPQGLVPKAMGIEEFFSRAFFTPHKHAVSSHIYRILLHAILRTLLEQRPALTNLLVFEQSFLGYLQGSEFLLPFFREIARHKVSMSEIPLRDIYADYEEHLGVLEEIHSRFVSKLDELGLERLDDAQEVVKEFVQGFEQIEIYLDGLLNPIEQEKLYTLSAYAPLHIHIDTDDYNYTYFRWLYGDIGAGFSYTFVLDSRASGVDNTSPLESSPTSRARLVHKRAISAPLRIQALYFELRIAQCSFVLEKVRELLASGVDGDEIVIITPDEGFSEYVSLLDSALNLNYAMGKKLLSLPKNRAWVNALYDVLQSLAQRSGAMSDLAFIESIFSYIFTQAHIAASCIDSQVDSQEIIDSAFSRVGCGLEASYRAKLDALPPCPFTTRIQAKILRILRDYMRIECALDGFDYGQIIELLFLHIEELSIDDVCGGKVRVMGILETRGISYDYVIVVDCNSGFIPRIKESDIFLNTAIREKLHMPTLQDRENLQKHYYYQLFARARKGVFITYTQNEEARESSLLNELELQGVPIVRDNGDAMYALFAASEFVHHKDEHISGDIGDFAFSPTSLITFAECKRRFYYRYMARLKEPDPLESTLDSLSLGELVHKALEQAYSAHKGKICDEGSIRTIQAECEKYLYTQLQKTSAQTFLCEQILYDLYGFWQLEERLARDGGFCVLSCEQGFLSNVCIEDKCYSLTGKIDRIDVLADGKWRVIDYKLSKPSAQNDRHLLQLAFYRLALESTALVFKDTAITSAKPTAIESMVYYLKDTKSQRDRILMLSQEDFQSQCDHIVEILTQVRDTVCFDKTQDIGHCVGCVYADMCNR